MELLNANDLEVIRAAFWRTLILWAVWEFALLQLRRLDGRLRIKWIEDVLPVLKASGVGMGLYMGGRILAVAIIVSRAIP